MRISWFLIKNCIPRKRWDLKNIFFVKKFLMEKKFEKKKGKMRDALVYHFPDHDFFLLRVLAGHLSIRGQFCQPSTANWIYSKSFGVPFFVGHFIDAPSVASSVRRYSGLVHASLIISGQPAGWRAEKVTNEEYKSTDINISYERRAICSSFMNFTSCTFHSHFLSHFARECAISQLLLTHWSATFWGFTWIFQWKYGRSKKRKIEKFQIPNK